MGEIWGVNCEYFEKIYCVVNSTAEYFIELEFFPACQYGKVIFSLLPDPWPCDSVAYLDKKQPIIPAWQCLAMKIVAVGTLPIIATDTKKYVDMWH